MDQSSVISNKISYITPEEAAELASEILSSKHLKVNKFSLEPFSAVKLGYMSDHLLLTIQVQENTNNSQSMHNFTFFAKSLSPNSNAFAKHVFQEENHFYGNFIPLLRNIYIEPWAPKCYLIKKDLLILENLRSEGFYSAEKQLTGQQLKSAITTLAYFHASSIILEHQLKVPLTIAFPGFYELKTFKNDSGSNLKFLTAGKEVAESIACDLGLDPKYIAKAYDVLIQERHLIDNDWNVLCHQDLWINNMMFSKDDKYCRILDFQMVTYGSFATDIVQLLYMNLNKESRLKYEHLSLEIYHSVLKKTLILNGIANDKIMSLEKMFETVEKKRIYGLFSAVILGPLVHLNKHFSNEYTKDPILHGSYNHVSRKDFVKNVMRFDNDYRVTLEESVKELINYMRRKIRFLDNE